jgi:hypothetical protein
VVSDGWHMTPTTDAQSVILQYAMFIPWLVGLLERDRTLGERQAVEVPASTKAHERTD